MDGIKMRGFFRVAIEENGKVVGDSGFVENLITNDGIELFMARTFGAQAGSLQVGFVTLGTGAVPASNATALPGETLAASKRVAPTYAFTQRAASDGTATVQFTATFASSDSFLSAAANLNNIGLANLISQGTIMAGNTFASSSCNTNQNVNVTYQIRLN